MKKPLRMKAVPGEKGIYARGRRFLAKAAVAGREESAGTHDTIAAAKRARALKLAEMIREQEQGRPDKYDLETTFEVYAEEFLRRRGTASNVRAFSPATLRAMATHFRRHLIPAFGDLRLGKITPGRIEEVFEQVCADAAPKYRRNVFQSLALIFDDAFRKRVISYDPTEHLPLPKVPRRRIRVPPPEQVRQVLDEMRSPWKDAALLAASSGLREGEVLALEWSDIDVARSCIRITKSRDQAGGVKTPKTDESVREVIVTKETLDALFAYRERTRRERAAALRVAEAAYAFECARPRHRTYIRTKPLKNEILVRRRRKPRESVRQFRARRAVEALQSSHWDVYMFPAAIVQGRKHRNPERAPVLEPRTLLRELHRAAAVVGITLRFHDLRHVWASVVLQLGGDSALKFVSNNLGHTTSSFTLDTYAHFLPNRAADFLKPINALYHGQAPHTPSHSNGREEPENGLDTGLAPSSGQKPSGPS